MMHVSMQVLAKSDGDPDDELLSVTTVKDGALVRHELQQYLQEGISAAKVASTWLAVKSCAECSALSDCLVRLLPLAMSAASYG